MNTSYPFKVGKLECVAVADGINKYEARLLFINAPEVELRQALAAFSAGPEELDIPYTCLVVKVNMRWVLVDTGAGRMKGVQVGQITRSLAEAGIEPTDIEIVILTHGHRDHIGGLADEDGKLKFRDAQYVMDKREWDFWRVEENLVKMGWENEIPMLERNLGSIEGRVELIEGNSEILPGLRVRSAEGHTPGHMAVIFTSEGEELWSTGDVLIHPIHLEHLDWYTAYDLAPEEAIETKLRILDEVENRVTVHAFHFPFPGIGRVSRKGERWSWHPIEGNEPSKPAA